MSESGQTHFKNLAANDHFRTLCIKGLNKSVENAPNDFPLPVADFHFSIKAVRHCYVS